MNTMPYVRLPFCDNEAFSNAVKTVRLCRSQTKCYGFEYPFFAPGGAYGDCWWSLDYALAVDGYKWIEPCVEKDFIMNMSMAQEKDGRIKLYGIDRFDSHFRDTSIVVGSLPKYFETAYTAFLRADDEKLKRTIYSMLRGSLEWWKTNRYVEEISLYYAIFEETFVPNTEYGREEYCPVDLNMQLVRGYENTAEIAAYFGENDIAEELRKEAGNILRAVNVYLWNEEKGAFYPYNAKLKKHHGTLMVSSFNGLMFGNADAAMKEKMLAKLTDSSLFGWERYALTTFAGNEPGFSVVNGAYNGNPSWSGSVWTLTNRAVIQALEECGEKELAAELCERTVCEFRNNYSEFLNPINGEGQGVRDYAWTASQFIQIIIEDIFGISYNAAERTVTVKPNLPKRYARDEYVIENLALPDGHTLGVHISEGNISCEYDGDFEITE